MAKKATPLKRKADISILEQMISPENSQMHNTRVKAVIQLAQGEECAIIAKEAKRSEAWFWMIKRLWKPEEELKLKGFQVLSKRWVVERTFAWVSRCRRLSKDYERYASTTEHWFWLRAAQLSWRKINALNQQST